MKLRFFIAGNLRPSSRGAQPFPPGLLRAPRRPRLGFKARLVEVWEGTGHLTPGTRARLPDVVILLVMESPGSFCLCRFQHLLRKKWEALRKTAKDVFSPQGPSSWGHGLSIIAEISLRNGTRQPCPEGEENERHMGPLSQDLPGLAPMQGRGFLVCKLPRQRLWGGEPHGLRKMAHLRGFGVHFHHSGLSTHSPKLSPALRPTGGLHHRDPDTCTNVSVLGEGVVKVEILFPSISLKVNEFQYLHLVSGNCIFLAVCVPFLPVRGCEFSVRPRCSSEF